MVPVKRILARNRKRRRAKWPRAQTSRIESEFGSPAPIPPGFEAGNIKTMPESSPRSCPDHSFSTNRRLPLLDHLPTQAHSPPDHSHATFPLLAFQAPTTPKWIEERKNENGGENSSALFGSLEDDSTPPNLSNTTGGKGRAGRWRRAMKIPTKSSDPSPFCLPFGRTDLRSEWLETKGGKGALVSCRRRRKLG